MSVKRRRVATTIRATAKNGSEPARKVFDAYRYTRGEALCAELQRYGSRKARQRGVWTERDVERLVFEDR